MIFFDFDGTIVDVWSRYYQVFCLASGINWVTQTDYVEAKRTLVSDRKVSQFFSGILPEEYFFKKRILLEDPAYLQLDFLLLPSEELELFFLQNECRFLTSRRKPESFLAELEGLGIGQLSGQVIILNPDSGISKTEFLRENFSSSPHIVVGDSEAEWETATLENVHAVLVQTGLRNPEDFPLEGKRSILPSVRDFLVAYRKKGS